MISPVSSSHASHVSEAVQSNGPKAEPQAKAATSLPPDTVTLKSTGDVDHDGDKK